MKRDTPRLLVDAPLLTAGLFTFASGLILLFYFHVGGGAFRASAIGLDRLTWLNLHRWSALVTSLGICLHLLLNRKPFVLKLKGFTRRLTFGRAAAFLGFCTVFATVIVTGFIVWLAMDGSTPLTGPVTVMLQHDARHHVVDVHNITGIVALVAAAHHTLYRRHWLVRNVQQLIGTGPSTGRGHHTRESSIVDEQP
jgi:hypothetical protein